VTKPIPKQFFARETLAVAKDLIGAVLTIGACSGRIVEVEAYTDDEASHGYRRTDRSAIMYDTFGHVYVYFIYGMYHCLNFTTDKSRSGAVLIRAIEPLSGMEIMKKRRGVVDNKKLCNGPGKLCKAFNIDLTLNGTRVGDKVKLFKGSRGEVLTSPRIGIKKATELNWRFYEADNPFVSHAK
jgi:DNA-3-methyladenine glycosylase